MQHSLEFRLHLRYELLMLGMQEIVDRLRNELDNPTLHDHIDLFDMMRQEDEQEMTASMDSGASSPVDYENPAAMADVLTHRLADLRRPAASHFTPAAFAHGSRYELCSIIFSLACHLISA